MNEGSLSETHDFDKISPVNKELNSMSEDVQETPSSTPNFKTELAKQLQELVPEAIADGKVDVVKLKELLGNDADDSSERFGLFWPGKLRAIRAAQEPTTATLAPEPEKSKDWDTTKNVFIEGDNLESLKTLQKYYHGKIKMIYIDPPYNTGKDFIYPDNYQEGLKTYLEWTKQVNEEGQKIKSNPETDGRYHSHWLNMMYPRLKLARSLLSDDGVVFISIDDNEQANLKTVCDEIFGESNFVAQVTTIVKTEGRRYGFFAKTHEYFLVYAKNTDTTDLNEITVEGKTFRYSDTTGGFNLRELRNQNTKAFNSTNRPNLRYPFYVDTNANAADDSGLMAVSVDPIYPLAVEAIKVDGLESVWRWGRDKAHNQENDLVGRKGSDGIIRIFQKVRQLEEAPKTVWFGKKIISNKGTQEVDSLLGGKFFDFPKPVDLVKQMVSIGTNQNSIILDFFAGSSTTAHAVMQLNAEDGGNRRHIQVQLPEPVEPDSPAGKAGFKTIADIARKRIDLAGEKIKQDYAEQLAKRDTPLDVGYRAFKLTDTNFAKWRESSSTDQGTLEQHLLDLRDNANDDATELALLTEVLLKQGYSLTEKVEKQTIDGLSVWSIGDNNLALAYMDERVKPTLEQLRALVDREPEKLIILEDAFQGDDELKTNLVQAAKTKHVELWTA